MYTFKFLALLFVALLSVSKAVAECGGACAFNFDPHCGTLSDGSTQTFSNKCAFLNQQECQPEVYKSVRKGACHEKPQADGGPFTGYSHDFQSTN